MPSTEEKLRQYLKRVTMDLGQTRQRLREVEERSSEPIAVIGMACRYPGGVRSPEDLWDLVAAGRDAIGDFPADRGWDLDGLYHPDPEHPGTTYVRVGGFVEDAAEFDAAFFGISPREALGMDPQQRLLLETAWEAFERARIDPATLKGTPTGVYAGAGLLGFGTPHIDQSAEGYLLTGNTLSVVSGRVAYTLGLEGPAVTMDTACSSSLVAMHLAAQALRSGECSLALAGGVTVMTTPSLFTEFSRQRGLAPDGRCKPFAAGADGTGFAEGAGLIVLERLSDARRNGHTVLAVIRGSAINQDGASNGLSAPNGPSQRRVIRQALDNAGLSPSDVDAVEAHGTGTTLGDPIEADALLATYGQDRTGEPLWLGSIKSNIGHPQAAAGVAGVIKMVMALRRGTLPASLGVDAPTPHVDWSSGGVRLLTEAREWRTAGRPRRAGVSAFGISGTNAHVILEEAPEEEPAPAADLPDGTVLPWVLSARTATALRAQAEALSAALGEANRTDVGWSLATARSAFEHRAVLIGRTRDELTAGLSALAAGAVHAGVVSPESPVVGGAGPVLVFPGQGSQWVGMGAELLESSPVFAARIAECEAALSPYVDWSLTEVLRGGDLGSVDVVQPVLWAVMVSLAAVWADYGVTPAAVVGHSQGEIAAACVAGALSLEDAAKVVALRSKALRRLAGAGAMASLGVDEARAAELIGEREVSVAAVNGPASTVISGPPEQVRAVVADAQAADLRARVIDVDYASHGPQVEELREELADVLAGIRPRGSDVAFYSAVTGGRIDTAGLDAGYWYTNLREPVRFADAVRALLADEYRIFIEASPHPVLNFGVQECFEEAGVEAVTVPTLRRDEGGLARLTESAALAYTAGAAVDWTRWFPADPAPRVVDLPTYAFQRQRFWGAVAGTGDLSAAGLQRVEHALLPAAIGLPDGGFILTGRLSAIGWTGEHEVLGTRLLPGTALVEWALQAADEAGCGGVEELALQAPLVLPESGGLRIQVVVGAADAAGRRDVRINSSAGAAWTCHAVGVLGEPGTTDEGLPGAWPPPGAERADIADFYQRATAAGYAYGPAFQGLTAVWRDGADLLAEVTLPEAAGERGGFGIHPALLDAALHPAFLLDEGEPGAVRLPFVWSDVSLHAAEAGTVRVRLSPFHRDGDEFGLRVTVADATGAPVLTAGSVVTRPADPAQLRAAGHGAAPGGDGLFTLDWTPLASRAAAARATAVLGDGGLDALLAGDAPLPPIVFSEVHETGPAAGTGAVEAALDLAQRWLAEPRTANSRLAFLTRGAVAGGPNLSAAAVWGLIRSAQTEHPDRFLLLDHDLSDPRGVEDAAFQAVAAAEPQAAVRDGRVLVPRLVRAGAGEDAARDLDPDGTVLITGGTGVLGGLVAEHLVRGHGVRHLVLASRSGAATDAAADLVRRLTDLGADVRVAAADVADPAAVRDLVAGIGPDHPLTGVVHAAGALDDAVLTSQSPERLARVWGPKAAAALYLHEATADLPLAMFAVFSSAAAALGAAGQANYAAANAFCDALAAHRRASGLPGVSVGWGLWAATSDLTGGLAGTDLARMGRLGVTPMSTGHGLALLDTALRHGAPYFVAAGFDLTAITGDVPAALRGLAGRVRRRAVSSADGSALAGRLAGLDDAGRREALLRVVRECAAVVLGHESPAEVGAEASFKELGFDSLTAVELRNRLSAACGLRLPATLVFDHPTPKVLAAHLGSLVTGERAVVSAAATAGVDEPIAIVGMACRFPGGVRSPEDLWDLVVRGGDAMGEFPEGRGWDLAGLFHPDPDHPGTCYAREGAFLYDADEFDAAFFGISPREALAMDPQQRLLLETSWEVLERAGIDPASLKGSRTGVYAGLMYHDYAIGLAGDDTRTEGFAISAGSGSVVSGRVAYSLGLEGPALTIDTACSSSLVAMHLAAHALRQGECGLALAGGVTVMATPEVFTGFSRQRGLAPDGRCKPFAAGADGTGWGEGVGVLLLERLSDAERNGHRVHAVIRGSAVNQDGASNGLTAPNGPSQQRVIAQALANARLSPADVDAVEGHGTGTTLGDPIEAQALLAAYGQDRAEPLWLGSIKSNIGHTQAAAGVAGVIKMVLAMRHGVLPESLHVDAPSPHVDWESGAVRLLTGNTPWPDAGRPRRAGVSSFGASGTNAHVILEQGPAPAEREPVAFDGVVPWVLSARDEKALRAQAKALTAWDGSPADIGWSLVRTRATLECRAVVAGRDRDELAAALADLTPGRRREGTRVWLFSGQGSQRVGMGAGLYARFPVFAAAFDEVAGLLDLEHPLRDVVFAGEPDVLDHTTYAQAGLFALQVALARLMESFGLRPDAVIGHSIGEVAAAYVAGVFDLADACRLVAARATLMGGLPEGGAMAAIQATAEELGGRIAVAALNTPDSTVVSGPEDQVAAVVREWRDKGRKVKNLTVSHAFHSELMDPILADFTRAVTGLAYRAPRIPLISNLTGEPADERITTPEYWAEHIRRTVCFQPAVAHVAGEAGVFFELGPDPVLATAAEHCLDDTDALAVAALNGRQDDVRALATALGRLHAAGDTVDWTPWFPADPAPRVVDLPTYPFQRRGYWLSATGAGDVSAAGLRRVRHALLPAAVGLADGGFVLTGRIAASGGERWLGEHVMAGAALLPGAALVEWALRAADEVNCAGVEELTIQAPLLVPASGGLRVQVVAGPPDADGRRDVRIHSRPEHDADADGTGWTCHATGALTPHADPVDGPAGPWPPAGAEPIDVTGFYDRAAADGYEYGPAFRGLRAAWRDGADVLAEVTLPEEAAERAGHYGIHPALLDAALHPALLTAAGEPGTVWLPFSWTDVSLWAAEATSVRVRISPAGGEDGLRVLLTDPTGAPVLGVGSLVLRPADADRLRPASVPRDDGLFTLSWTALAPGAAPREDWAVLGGDRFGLAEADDAAYAGLGELLAAGTLPPIVLTQPDTSGDDACAAGLAATTDLLALIQDWLAEPRLAESRLVVITRAAVDTSAPDTGAPDTPGPEPLDAAAAGAWGLIRSAQTENPGRFVLLDLDRPSCASAVREAVARAAELDEPQVAVRADRVLVPRVTRTAAATGPLVGEPAWRLELDGSGTVDDVVPVPCPQVMDALKPGQVRISVRAAGVNFRDVLISLGMVPGQTGLGGEGAGVVTETGPGVTGLRPGDRVMGVFAGAFGPWAVADARMVARVPDGWTFRQAAAVPVAFLTAWYGLAELGGLRPGETVLIHSATGGVGTAAVRIARHLGAEVYATASPGKHAVLAEMGIDERHRASSRDLAFEDAFREATGGKGVDVVLNSLAGEFTDASLRLLGEGGRLLEMGKTDIRDPERVTADHPGVSYQVYDLVTDAGPDRIERMLATLTGLFADGVLAPPPVRAWPLARARDALRHLSQARHTGKVVLDVPAPVDPDGTILITGGTGTLGGLVAEHLARVWHARHLLLAGRRGPDAEGAAGLAARLAELGADTRIVAADVTDVRAVEELVAGIDPAHPLTGVVHAAGVLDDAVVTSQTPESLRRVWAAKATAAANLHRATEDLRLGLFTVFSSAAAALGSPGQANYAAANAFCDALAARRRAAGLEGVSVAWGLWAASSGMTGGLAEADLARMGRSGIAPLPSEQALGLFDASYRHGGPHVIAVNLDVRALAAQPADALPAALRALAAGPGARARRTAAGGGAEPADWAARLSALPADERRRALLDLVRTNAATVLGHTDPEAVGDDTVFRDLGFDSLTGVELRNRLASATGLRLPAALVFDHPSPSAVAGYLLERLAPAEAQGGADPVLNDLARLETALTTLTLEDTDANAVTARLEGLLTKWKAKRATNGGPTTAERLSEASKDQLLAFIDNELGVS